MTNRTLQQIVESLNNTGIEGGIWLPIIQREFVWSAQQIYRFYDSIMREYPFGTLLIWKTNSDHLRHRKFIDNYKENIQISNFYVPPNNNRKSIVLDGQQRLQSLLIGLKGSYDEKHLYFNILSGDKKSPEDVRYEFKFRTLEGIDNQGKLWIKFSDIVQSKNIRKFKHGIITSIVNDNLNDEKQDRIEDNLHKIHHVFTRHDGISYQEIDGMNTQEDCNEEDIVEIFIRANDGGTSLSKSDLLFSLLSAGWDDANQKIGDLIDTLQKSGFLFRRDFILKTCLVLLDKGAKYDVKKFRQPDTLDTIEKNWDSIENSILDVIDFITTETYIRDIKALPSSMVLIPLIYSRFKFPDTLNQNNPDNPDNRINDYIVRSQLVRAFSGRPDNLIDECVKTIDNNKGFKVDDIFMVIRKQARALSITEDRLWAMGYDSDYIHLIFNLWHIHFKYNSLFKGNHPQVDHIFPKSKLNQVKCKSNDTGRAIQRYSPSVKNQLANCMLLSQKENSKKSDKLPSEWFKDKDENYLNLHCIPKDENLWELDRFEDFIDARKKLIKEKLVKVKILDMNSE